MPLFNGYGEVQHKGMICLKAIILETSISNVYKRVVFETAFNRLFSKKDFRGKRIMGLQPQVAVNRTYYVNRHLRTGVPI